MNKVATFGILTMLLAIVSITGCKKDFPDPANAITLNMLNEKSGNTRLGTSTVYINKANNFFAPSELITDLGQVSGLGEKNSPMLNNLAKEVAVVIGHAYQFFDKSTIREFPSGNYAVQAGAGYYQLYVISSIMSENINTGAVVKYSIAFPNSSGLPEYGQNVGRLTYTDRVLEIPITKGAECVMEYGSYTDESAKFRMSIEGNKLIVRYNIYSQYGEYTYVYIRLGNVYSAVRIDLNN